MAITDELSRAVRFTYLGLNRKLIERQSAMAFTLLREARIKEEGDTLKFNVWYQRQPNGWYAPYGQFATVRREAVLQGSLNWKHQYGIVQIDGPTLRANVGYGIGNLLRSNSLRELGQRDEMKLYSIIDEQMLRVVDDMKYTIGTSLYGDGTAADGLEIQGLKAIVDNSTSSYAGLAPTSFETDTITNNSWWTPQVNTNSGTLRPLTLELLGKMQPLVVRNGDRPGDVKAYMNIDLWTNFELLMEGRKTGVDAELEQLGYKNIQWNNVTYMQDERCLDNKIYYLNTNHIYFVIRESANFSFEGFSRPHDQDAIIGSVITDIQLVCDDRHRMGLLGDVQGVGDLT